MNKKNIEDNLSAGKVDSAYRKIKTMFVEVEVYECRGILNKRSFDSKPVSNEDGNLSKRWKEYPE